MIQSSMSLKGNIESIYLSSILQLLCNDNKSGVLRVWNDDEEVKIYLDEGTIVYSIGSEKFTRLGYFLRSEGLIPDQVLWNCLQLSRKKKQALGKTLVEKGLITIEKLEELACRKTEQCLYNLFLWRKGEFEYKETKLNLDGHILTKINTMEIILEALRRADEMTVLQKQFPSDKQVLQVSGNIQKNKIRKFDSDNDHILSLINGKRTIREIIKANGIDSFSV